MPSAPLEIRTRKKTDVLEVCTNWMDSKEIEDALVLNYYCFFFVCSFFVFEKEKEESKRRKNKKIKREREEIWFLQGVEVIDDGASQSDATGNGNSVAVDSFEFHTQASSTSGELYLHHTVR